MEDTAITASVQSPVRNFKAMLQARWAAGKYVCVGLDSEYKKIPISAHRGNRRETMVAFNKAIVDATHDLVCAYKLQVAFYEEQGAEGIAAMIESVRYIKEKAPEIPIIVDAKRADVDNTNEAYAKAIFDTYGFDAVTISPYLGIGTLQPFLDRKDKGIIILCRTSNKSAVDFQDLHTTTLDPRNKPDGMSADRWLSVLCEDSMPLYQRVALMVKGHNKNGNLFLVVGATYPNEGKIIRELVGDDLPFLVPGPGKQGGDTDAIVMNCRGKENWCMIINSSRAIIFALDGPDFAEAARGATQDLHKQIVAALAKAAQTPSPQ